jgi:hypothetical protein
MAISPAHFSTTPITQAPVVLEFLGSRPNNSTLISPARPAGQMCGYYDATTQTVELYIVDASGIRFKRVG